MSLLEGAQGGNACTRAHAHGPCHTHARRVQTYRRGLHSGPLVDNATWFSTPQSHKLPGGSGLVELKDVAFLQRGGQTSKIKINQHCARPTEATGGLCASHYFINNPRGPHALTLEITDGSGSVGKTDAAVEYNGYTWIRDNANAAFNTTGCASAFFSEGGDDTTWRKCPQSWGVRVVRVYSPDRGTLRVTTTEGEYNVSKYAVNKHPSVGAAYGEYSPVGTAWARGYTFLVKADDAVALDWDRPGRHFGGLFVLEYSEATWPASKQTQITLELRGTGPETDGLAGGPFPIASTHSRDWITPYGALIPQAGAWWAAMSGSHWNVSYGPLQYETERSALLSAQGIGS